MITASVKVAMALAAGLASSTGAMAQNATVTPEYLETVRDLVTACTTYSTRDTQQTCIEQIAIETHQLYADYRNGMNGNVSAFHLGMLSQELNEACGTPMNRDSARFIGPAIQNENLVTAVNAMNDYSGGCLSRMIDAQLGEFQGLLGDFSIDMTDVPFDGNRLELIDAFRNVAVGEAIPDHPLRNDNRETFFGYKGFIFPAFSQ